jgi:hypothetical protein
VHPATSPGPSHPSPSPQDLGRPRQAAGSQPSTHIAPNESPHTAAARAAPLIAVAVRSPLTCAVLGSAGGGAGSTESDEASTAAVTGSASGPWGLQAARHAHAHAVIHTLCASRGGGHRCGCRPRGPARLRHGGRPRGAALQRHALVPPEPLGCGGEQHVPLLGLSAGGHLHELAAKRGEEGPLAGGGRVGHLRGSGGRARDVWGRQGGSYSTAGCVGDLESGGRSAGAWGWTAWAAWAWGAAGRLRGGPCSWRCGRTPRTSRSKASRAVRICLKKGLELAGVSSYARGARDG